ncbi:MAG: bifunctional 2-polyprenyl-6-hydroxyphenol methylase/3-demethylubiquinol 3-O-methyltransferase UbiG [Gammaproteobacteria bacterium]|nr:bifunctional 2-polyprenyl-6-hydroxyphenol methylase/3-demethylubiquinol 3-O-methyltransferase UbiG [Gammaproteobacteria bacterium]
MVDSYYHGPEGGQANEAEVAKFDAIAHRFWDPMGEFGTLHTLNPARVSFINERAALRSPSTKIRVADIGCGGGLLAEALVRAGAEVTAIDLAPGMIKVAKLHAAGEGLPIDYRVQSVEGLAAEASASFDVVTCMEMLEHLPDPGATLHSLSRLLKPEGSLFVSTLNRNFRSFMLAIVGAEYVTRLVPRGTHEYERMIRPSELAQWARQANLAIHELAGLEYNPVTRSARLTADVSVNYLSHLRRADSAQ